MQQRIGFIGGGAMGEAILKGLLAQGRQPGSFLISDLQKERRHFLEEKYKVRTTAENKDVVALSDIVLLAIKPQNLQEVAADCVSVWQKEKVLISILAGASIEKLAQLFPAESKIIRVMPNTPALVGAGTTVLAGGPFVPDLDLQIAVEIFSALGRVTILPEEMLNAVTGLSGSGPAFVALFIEALADGGVLAGLPRQVAQELALDTVKGTVKLLTETGMHPAELKDKVTSPAGTTIYGLSVWEKSGIRGTIMETIWTAAQRAGEM